ncbi:MAG: RagB/SusD family nutrient uptake outer membrane protein [Bacteroidales bacterium]|nr:RagB/SusD family nutrient uptake outer membrane protein [Bacteroidales bacterium]
MKKYIIALFAILSLAASCNINEFLTEDPVMSQSTELTLSDYNGLNKAIAGAYSPLAGSGWYGAFFVLDAEMRAGNAMIPINTNFQSGRMQTPYTMNYNPDNTSGLWGTAYYVISACNNVINAIDNNAEALITSSHPQADLNNLKAEALALRALSHFDLLRLYCHLDGSNGEYGVCVITEPQLPTDMPARASVEETYAQIIKDLTDAESLMSDGYQRGSVADPKATFNKLAIQALLARVYLYHKEYSKAAEYATKVINSNKFQLWTAEEYPSVWGKEIAGNGGEVIFEIYGKQTNSYDAWWEGPSHMTNPIGYADCAASAQLTDLFEDGDVRGTRGVRGEDDGKVLFCTDQDQVSGGQLWTMKYYGKGDGNATSTPDFNNVIVLRLSEMYLIRAEAAVNGAGSTAQADLNAIRSNRGASLLTAVPTKNDVALERRLELNFEGHLWFDLDRTGGSISYSDANITRNIAAGDKLWALPIPKSQVDINENLVQNPGY